jgi:hypothetical protein
MCWQRRDADDWFNQGKIFNLMPLLAASMKTLNILGNVPYITTRLWIAANTCLSGVNRTWWVVKGVP